MKNYPNGSEQAFCKLCYISLVLRKATLVSHQDPEKHKGNARAVQMSRPSSVAKITIYISIYIGVLDKIMWGIF